MTSHAARVSGFLAPARDARASDAELMNRFVADRDGPAFAALVARHGPMVFGACHRVVRDWHAAEDAFQATFLVLARRAASVSPPGAVARWLYGVACRVAKDARRAELRRAARERPATELPEPSSPERADTDLRDVLDDELRKLPEKYRDLLVACDLEERPRAPVAAALGIPEGTLSSRLTAARKMLAARLAKRGVGSAVVAAIGLNGVARSVVACEVPRSVLASAARLGCGPAGTVPVSVASLASGAVRAMTYRPFAPVAVLLFAAASALGAALAATEPPPLPQAPPAPKPGTLVFVAPPEVAPPPKTVAKPLPKGPNRILLRRNDDLLLLDPNGKNEKKIGGPSEKYNVRDARLSPDGKRYAALTHAWQGKGEEPPKPNLFVRGVDEPEPGTDLGVAPDSYVWSRDGTEIACSEDTGSEDARESKHFIINVKTKEKKVLKLPSGHFITDWSPDGNFFVTLHAHGDKADLSCRLYRTNRDGTGCKALTGEKECVAFGLLSPDGKRVLYLTTPLPLPENEENPRLELAVVEIATGRSAKVRDVPLNASVLNCCWSPDGKQIAYLWRHVHEGLTKEELLTKETESHLIVCDPDGKNQKTVLTEKGAGQYREPISELDWR